MLLISLTHVIYHGLQTLSVLEHRGVVPVIPIPPAKIHLPHSLAYHFIRQNIAPDRMPSCTLGIFWRGIYFWHVAAEC